MCFLRWFEICRDNKYETFSEIYEYLQISEKIIVPVIHTNYRPNLNFKPTLNFLPTWSFRTKPIIEPHNRNFMNSCNALDRHKFLTHVVYTPTDQLAHLAHVTHVATKFCIKRPFFCISVQSNQKVVFVLFGIIRRVLYITISWFNIRTNKGFISLVYMQI